MVNTTYHELTTLSDLWLVHGFNNGAVVRCLLAVPRRWRDVPLLARRSTTARRSAARSLVFEILLQLIAFTSEMTLLVPTLTPSGDVDSVLLVRDHFIIIRS